MKGISIVVSLLAISAFPVVAQYDNYGSPGNNYGYYGYYPAPPPAPAPQILAGDQLDQLLAPIALYPDPVIAQILPAASQPSQIAVAANYVNSGGDPNGIDAQPWDSSVKAIAHSPQILQLLDGNLQWTAELGQAFLNQPTDVMNSVQRLRAQAMAQGNLQNTPEQNVINQDGLIEIVPANPEVIYVPQYDPSLVYFQPGISINWGWWHFGIGPWFNHDFDWDDHRVVEWDHDHPRPRNWWHEPYRHQRDEIRRAPEWRAPAEHREPGRSFWTPNRGDRGYAAPAPRPRHEARPVPAPHELRPPVPTPHEFPAPHLPAPSLPAPGHGLPGLPGLPSIFGGHSASETRAASVRGAESRQGFGHSAPQSHAARPSHSAPAPQSHGGGNDHRH